MLDEDQIAAFREMADDEAAAKTAAAKPPAAKGAVPRPVTGGTVRVTGSGATRSG